MIKLFVLCPNLQDITSLYRGVGPYGRLRTQFNKELDVDLGSELDLGKVIGADVVIFQRPFNALHTGWIKAIKALGKPLIVDYDDDVLSVPKSNPHSKIYCDPNTITCIKHSLNDADHVTVSTQTLKDKFLTYNKNITVIPNAVDFITTPFNKVDWTKKQRTIVWRGGESHTQDLLSVQNELKELSYELPDWLFVFMGGEESYMNHVLKTQLNNKNTTFLGGQLYFEYVKTMRNLSPLVNITPLKDDAFNRSKSNIAWLETAIYGSATIAPNMDEWSNKPGITTYSDAKDFKQKVIDVTSNIEGIITEFPKTEIYIKEKLDLVKVNRERYKLIKSLI